MVTLLADRPSVNEGSFASPETDDAPPSRPWPPTEPTELAALDAWVEEQGRRQLMAEGFDPFEESVEEFLARRAHEMDRPEPKVAIVANKPKPFHAGEKYRVFVIRRGWQYWDGRKWAHWEYTAATYAHAEDAQAVIAKRNLLPDGSHAVVIVQCSLEIGEPVEAKP